MARLCLSQMLSNLYAKADSDSVVKKKILYVSMWLDSALDTACTRKPLSHGLVISKVVVQPSEASVMCNSPYGGEQPTKEEYSPLGIRRPRVSSVGESMLQASFQQSQESKRSFQQA